VSETDVSARLEYETDFSDTFRVIHMRCYTYMGEIATGDTFYVRFV